VCGLSDNSATSQFAGHGLDAGQEYTRFARQHHARADTRTRFSRTTGAQDDDWVDMTAGLNVQITHSISAFAAVSQTTGLDSGEQTSYNAGISARF